MTQVAIHQAGPNDFRVVLNGDVFQMTGTTDADQGICRFITAPRAIDTLKGKIRLAANQVPAGILRRIQRLQSAY